MDLGILLAIGIAGMVGCVLLIIIGLTWKPAPKTEKPKAAAAASASGAAGPAAAPPVENGGREVLRVWRDAATEELWVELAGQRFAAMGDIRQPEMRAGLLTTLRDLEAFAGGAATVPPVVVPATALAAAAPVITPAKAGAAKPAATGTQPLVAPTMNPFKQMLVLRDLNKVEIAPMRTIAEQIDEILQEKLADGPHSQRGIRVHNGPKGQALFRTDGEDYDAVDSVPDDEVRTLIRAAVAEWEKKQ